MLTSSQIFKVPKMRKKFFLTKLAQRGEKSYFQIFWTLIFFDLWTLKNFGQFKKFQSPKNEEKIFSHITCTERRKILFPNFLDFDIFWPLDFEKCWPVQKISKSQKWGKNFFSQNLHREEKNLISKFFGLWYFSTFGLWKILASSKNFKVPKMRKKFFLT